MELSKSKYSEATASTGTNEDYKAYVEAEQAIEHL
jgi:hypothetical protein